MNNKLAPQARLAIAITVLAAALSACNPAGIVTGRTATEVAINNTLRTTTQCDPAYDMNHCQSVMP